MRHRQERKSEMASATKNNKTSRATATRTSRSAGRGKNLRDDRDKKYMFIIAALAVALIGAIGGGRCGIFYRLEDKWRGDG